MAYDTLVIAINWFGPYSSISEARSIALSERVEEALYLCIGQRDGDLSSYVGITSNAPQRLSNNHHKLSLFDPDDMVIWIGIIVSQAAAGRRSSRGSALHTLAVKTAEKLTAYFLQLPSNDRLRSSPPDRSAIVFNRWYEPSGDFKRRKHRGHHDWPDLIEYDQESEWASVVWFGGKRKRGSVADISWLFDEKI